MNSKALATIALVAAEGLYRPIGGGGGGGGITQLTGDVLAGPGSGAVPATVARINGATVPAAGALVTGNSLYVSGVSALSYSALNLAGGSGWVTGLLPVANIAPAGTNGFVLTTTGGATVWAAASGGSGITQLTGDVTAGPGSGSQAATVVSAQSGAVGWTITTGAQTWAAGATASIAQASTTGATGGNMTLTPQVSTAGSGVNGNLVVALSANTNAAAVLPALMVQQAGTFMAAVGSWDPPSPLLYGALWLGPGSSARGTASAALISDGATFLDLNVPSPGNINLQIGNFSSQIISASGTQFGFEITVQSLGGGTGVVGLTNASTLPTTIPTGLVLAEAAVGLYGYQPGSIFNQRLMYPVPQGTASSQSGVVVDAWGFGSTVGASSTTLVVVPLPTPSDAVGMIVTVVGRDTATEAACMMSQTVGFKNIAGTVSGVTTQGTLTLASDAVFVGTVLTYTISGTNIEIQVTPPPGAGVSAADWTCYVTGAVYN